MQREYFGIIYESELENEEVHMMIDTIAVSESELDGLTSESINDIDTQLMFITLNRENFSDFMSGKFESAENYERRWVKIDTRVSFGGNRLEVEVYSTNVPTGEFNAESIGFTTLNIGSDSISLIGKRKNSEKIISDKLEELISLNELYDGDKTAQLLEKFKVDMSASKFDKKLQVVNFNVGQGNATGVFDENLEPVLYIDLGGGGYKNKFTYPVAKEFPVNNNPYVILSHWDMDHYETAFRDVAKYANCKWIAPLQDSNFSIKKFANAVKENLVLIKDEFDRVNKFTIGRAVKCTGKKRNDSGIAVKLDLGKENDISEILFPGDSQYTYIDKQLTHVEALCATHHGGKLYSTSNFPTCHKEGEGLIVYSYGKNNSYKHPRRDTVNEHVKRGWGAERFGEKYSLGTTVHNVVFTTNYEVLDSFKIKYPSLGSFNCFYGEDYVKRERRGDNLDKLFSGIDND